MVVYIALCKNDSEALQTRDKLIAACPTLVFSRVLHRPRELDVYNADLLQTTDAAHKVGQLAYDQKSTHIGQIHKGLPSVVVAAVLATIAALWTIARLIRVPNTSLLTIIGIWAIVIGISAAYVFYNARVLKRSSSSAKSLWKAEQWLQKGQPVVIAGSDDPPDNHRTLPKNILYFDQVA